MKNIYNWSDFLQKKSDEKGLGFLSKLSVVVFISFVFQSLVFSQSNQIIGFASVPALGLTGTTGGEGGRAVIATDVNSLKTYMDSNEKLIIYVSGTMDLGGEMTPLRSNKSILGVGNNAKIINGGLELYKRNNIIIRNITFENAPDDAMKVNQVTHHLWVDHCTFTDGAVADPKGENHDGSFDITRESSYITISYCLFLNHAKTILIGHSDSYSADAGDLKVTLHHNWFNGTRSRHPRVRFGEVHVFNNYYTNNVEYGVASTCEADVVVEANYFKNVPYPAYVGYAESPVGDIVVKNNILDNSGTPQTRGSAFDPSRYYSYTPDAASSVPSVVMANAGAGKITIAAPAGAKAAKSEIEAGVKNDKSNSKSIVVYQNYPNPAETITTIPVLLNKPAHLKVSVLDESGKLIKVLADGDYTKGYYELKSDMSKLEAGIYIYRVEASNEVVSRRMIVK